MTDEDHEWYARYRREVEQAHWVRTELNAGRSIHAIIDDMNRKPAKISFVDAGKADR